MPKVMPNKFQLQRGNCVTCVCDVALFDARPIDQFDIALPATPIRAATSQSLIHPKAMQVIFAPRAGARDLQGREPSDCFHVLPDLFFGLRSIARLDPVDDLAYDYIGAVLRGDMEVSSVR